MAIFMYKTKLLSDMLPAKPQVLECPHCGGLQCISALMSGNTIGMTQWSDAKREAPMQPQPSLVMRCPHCRKYYFYEDKLIVGSCKTYYHSSWGKLSYASLKEALSQLQPTGHDETELRIMLIHAYNDLYGTMAPEDVPPHERLYFERNARKLIRLQPENKIFCAELHRELEEYDQALAILNEVTGEDYIENIAKQIALRAERRDPRVFVLNDNGEHHESRIAVTVDDVVYKYDPKKDVERKRKSIVEWLREKFSPTYEESEF